MKNRFLKLLFVCVLSVGLMISPVLQVVSFADNYDYLLSGDIGEFITDETDENVVAGRSSIATITNTVEWEPNVTAVRFILHHEETGKSLNVYKYFTSVTDTEAKIKYSAPDDYKIYRMFIYNVFDGNYAHSPKPGTYNMEIDISSAFSHSYSQFAFASGLQYDNANYIDNYQVISPQFAHGDIYATSNVTIASGLDRWGFRITFSEVNHNVDFTIRERFTVADPNADENYSTVQSGMNSGDIESDYKDNVSSSLSDVNTNLGNISSSMQEQATNIGKVETAVTNLQRAMEPHYDNILQQMHHITEQMAAMWTQVFNLIHVPQYARLGEILSAIQNLDVNITVDVDGLKSTINTMSTNIQNKLGTVQSAIQGTINTGITNVQNKLQNVQNGLETKLDNVSDNIQNKIDTATDTILNSFDNSELNEITNNLNSTSETLEDTQSYIFNSFSGAISQDNLSELVAIYEVDINDVSSLSFISLLLSSIFMSLGPFKLVIFFAFIFGFMSIIFGFYRVRD